MIAKKLAEIAGVNISKAIRILDRMVRGDREGRILGWLDSAKTILAKAMSKDVDARRCAEALIDYLGRRGYVEFGQLLK